MRFISILSFLKPPFVVYYQKAFVIPPPLYSFEHADDYVHDVKWSPTHPALFGTVGGTDQFVSWNLNADTEEPFVSTQVDSGKALNKLA